ncbi:MAG: type VII secretion protein EccB [Dermatophilaceae bacterium]
MAPPNRRDRLHSYQFLLQRMVSAFVTRDTDPIRSPFRRGGTTMFVGAMALIVIMAGAGVYGLLRPGGSKSWRVEGGMVVEKDTGAVFVYRDSILYPMANFTSARLVADAGKPPQAVSARSLAGVPRGRMLGILGLPDSLPAKKDMVRGSWSLCSTPMTGGDVTTGTRTTLLVGQEPASGTGLTDRGMLAQNAETRAVYLVWQGRRYALAGGVLEALALTQRPRQVVDDVWLETLPRGPDIAAPLIDGAGSPSQAVADALVGQVLRVRSQAGTEEFYLVLRRSLRPVTPLLAAVTVGSSGARAAYPGGTPGFVDVSPGDVANAPRETARNASGGSPDGLSVPARLPDLVAPRSDAGVCAIFGGRGEPLRFRVDVGGLPTGRAGGSTPPTGSRWVDDVVVPPGRAVLVEASTSADADSGVLSLVTDDGVRYGIPGVDAVQLLGYGSSELVTMPSALVDRVPSGPALDPARAARPTPLP